MFDYLLGRMFFQSMGFLAKARVDIWMTLDIGPFSPWIAHRRPVCVMAQVVFGPSGVKVFSAPLGGNRSSFV